MRAIRQAGITPAELDELVDAPRWREWCRAEPDLADFHCLKAIRELRGSTEDRALGALLRLAAKDGGDDQLAAVAVLHQLGSIARTIARHFWHAAGGDADAIVAGAMWEQIRAYDWRRRTKYHAAAIYHATRKSVRALLLRDDSRWQTRGVVPIDPQSWLIESIACPAEDSTASVANLGPQDQLDALLGWSLQRGIVNKDDVDLLTALMDADRGNPAITKWMRGACSMSAVAHAASQRGVCGKSVTRARDRAIAKLREAAPTFWDEVA